MFLLSHVLINLIHGRDRANEDLFSFYFDLNDLY